MDDTRIDLYWLPLGAGGRSVRLNGRVFEAVAAGLGRRRASDLYHSALEVRAPQGRFVIEMAPVLGGDGDEYGVVAEGAVGARAAAGSGSSATGFAAGATGSSRTWPRPSTVRAC